MYYWKNIKKNNSKNKTFIINFGPAHPAAHGVLRLVLQMSGETIERLDIHIGLLHRATETLITRKHYIKSIPYFDRLDYVSMLTQEHTYCLAVERLLNISVIPLEVNLIRVLWDELTRVLNHLLAVGCHALDIGSMSSLFWAFEAREQIMEFYERASGARMHAAYHKPVIQFTYQYDATFLHDILSFIQECYITLNEMHNVLTYNNIWKNRLINVGSLSIEDCKNFSLSGVLARSAGLKKDLRLASFNTYACYNILNFKSYCGVNGDSYDRYLIRMQEMGASLQICNNIIKKLLTNSKHSSNFIKSLYTKSPNSFTSMEDLISHFINWHTGFSVSTNNTLAAIESPKGIFAVMVDSNNTNKPVRCKIRSPSYFNLQALPKLAKGHLLGDLAALIGTIDVVFGEVDR